MKLITENIWFATMVTGVLLMMPALYNMARGQNDVAFIPFLVLLCLVLAVYHFKIKQPVTIEASVKKREKYERNRNTGK